MGFYRIEDCILSRVNYWYVNVYVLWLNTTLNIIVPIVSLVTLNINTSR